MKDRVLLLDFCGTVVPFQSADRFVRFVHANGHRRSIENVRYFNYRVLAKLGLISLREKISHKRLNKRKVLHVIKGRTKQEIDALSNRYYSEVIKPQINHETIEIMKTYRDDGYEIILLSAAYDSYLKYFAREYDISIILSTELHYDKKDRIDGRFANADCAANNKVTAFKNYLIDNNFEKPSRIVSITDSESDRPVMDISDEVYFVNKDKVVKVK